MVEIITPSDISGVASKKEELKKRIKELEGRLEREVGDVKARWIIGYIDGLSRAIADTSGEPAEEKELERLLVKALMLENINKLKEYSNRWMSMLKKAFLGEL